MSYATEEPGAITAYGIINNHKTTTAESGARCGLRRWTKSPPLFIAEVRLDLSLGCTPNVGLEEPQIVRALPCAVSRMLLLAHV